MILYLSALNHWLSLFKLTLRDCLSTLYSLLDRAQHQAYDDEISRREEQVVEHREQTWAAVGPSPQDQPRGVFIHFIEDERPTESPLPLTLLTFFSILNI